MGTINIKSTLIASVPRHRVGHCNGRVKFELNKK